MRRSQSLSFPGPPLVGQYRVKTQLAVFDQPQSEEYLGTKHCRCFGSSCKQNLKRCHIQPCSKGVPRSCPTAISSRTGHPRDEQPHPEPSHQQENRVLPKHSSSCWPCWHFLGVALGSTCLQLGNCLCDSLQSSSQKIRAKFHRWGALGHRMPAVVVVLTLPGKTWMCCSRLGLVHCRAALSVSAHVGVLSSFL